jgi:hypothetical protein
MANEQQRQPQQQSLPKRRKVLLAHFREGVQLGGNVVSGTKDCESAWLHPAGVSCVFKGREVIVPWSNVRFAEVEPE